jgi:hypothetical protein
MAQSAATVDRIDHVLASYGAWHNAGHTSSLSSRRRRVRQCHLRLPAAGRLNGNKKPARWSVRKNAACAPFERGRTIHGSSKNRELFLLLRRRADANANALSADWNVPSSVGFGNFSRYVASLFPILAFSPRLEYIPFRHPEVLHGEMFQNRPFCGCARSYACIGACTVAAP